MTTETTRALVHAFAGTMERRDWGAFAELLSADVVYEIPQTRERIRGRDQYVRFNADDSGDWHLEPNLVLADGDKGCLLFRWTVDAESMLAVALFEVEGERIVKVTDFWPAPYEPPAGREQLVERF